LSDRAASVAAAGGGHLREWLFEAVAVPVARDRSLCVRAVTAASPFDQELTITVLEVELGTAAVTDEGGVLLGDLPVDRCGMVLGDVTTLDAWTGPDAPSRDGLADVT
jgi:hypothetical protein